MIIGYQRSYESYYQLLEKYKILCFSCVYIDILSSDFVVYNKQVLFSGVLETKFIFKYLSLDNTFYVN